MSSAGPPQLPPIENLNRLQEDEFARAIRPLFEAAPPLAAALAARRPFASYETLVDGAEQSIVEMHEHQKIEVINAHPRIGESAEAVRQTSSLSYREQGYDAEAGLEPAEFERVYGELARLNAAYEAKFGFRFVVFVNRRVKSEIVEVLRERLHNPREQEMAAALEAMLLIACDRLRTLGPP